MSYNLTVWAWSEGYETSAERRKRGVKYDDVIEGFYENEEHPAMREFDFTEFVAAVEAQVGPQTDDGPYILERDRCAVTYTMPYRLVEELVPRISRLARKHGLTSAGR